MSDNVLQTMQQLIQDVIAPDVRELKVRVGSLEKQVETLDKHMEQRFETVEKKFETLDKHLEQRFETVDKKFEALEKHLEQRFVTIDKRFEALDKHLEHRFTIADQNFAAYNQTNEAQFKAILAAISESKAQAELASMRSVIALSERVAVLEAQQAQRN